jgi:peptidoglycan/xylan/chitin deacetylase (PgdA/CDA1 family)
MTLVPILAYHSISNTPHDGTLRWSVSPGDFEEHMALLRERGHIPLTISRYADALRGRARMPGKPVLVTFDDGFADLATTALPLLRRYGIAATAYVITERVNAKPSRDRDFTLDWDQLVELRAAGVEIGSHSHTHRALDCLNQSDLRDELVASRQLLEDGLHERVQSFAYPYGYHSKAVREAVHAAGYTSACAVKNALSHEGDDVFAIARVLIERDTGVATIDAICEGRGWPRAWRRERLRTRGWRAYRRIRRMVDGARKSGYGQNDQLKGP